MLYRHPRHVPEALADNVAARNVVGQRRPMRAACRSGGLIERESLAGSAATIFYVPEGGWFDPYSSNFDPLLALAHERRRAPVGKMPSRLNVKKSPGI